ncbi:uncharacterized protein LOC131989135 [Centropristis striata]|uniref:uncharacterized protein LOC131989135 n=1 Tax=Centropristis striata TaxID=184440 RepID=UPI0027DF5F6E|nr:uncharacterized protein LOC131989135 [Centropristis striata]
MAGPSLQIKTISVLVFHLFIAHSCRGQVQLIGSRQPIVGPVGEDVILPCHLQPAVDVATVTLEWTRSDLKPRFVHVWRAGQDLQNVKNPSYRGRTSLFVNELKKGNISLKLSKVKPSDAGRYRCFIPDMNINAVVELVVGAVSSPIISLRGIDRDKEGVVLQCESSGWYPEPEVLWLDGEGKLLSAGPTETVRGPDDLYTVSSRVTVEKRHSNSFTCRVHQKDTNHTTETHITVADEFFNVRSSCAPLIAGLAVSLVLCILLIFAVFFFVWKWRQNITNKTDGEGEKKRSKTKKSEDQFDTEEEKEPLNEKEEDKIKQIKNEVQLQVKDEKQRNENKLEPPRTEYQKSKDDPEIKCKEAEEKASQSNSWVANIPPQDQTLTRSASQDSAPGHISVDEVDLEGGFVRLSNNSEQDQTMGKWELHLQVNNRKPIKYSFKKKFKLKVASSVTIWAAGSIKGGDTSTDLVWLDQMSWGAGEQLLVNLYSNTGELKVREALELDISQKKYKKNYSSFTSLDFAKGHIMVEEADMEGNYVRLRNNSSSIEKQQLRDWELHIEVHNRKPIMYKFPNSVKIKSGETVTIWSSDHSDKQHPSTDLVWQKQKSWGIGEQLLITLYSSTGELEDRIMLEPEGSQSKTQEQDSQDKKTIIVDDVNLVGKSVRLINKSDKPQQLRGWKLHLVLNNSRTIIHTLEDRCLYVGHTSTVDLRKTSLDVDPNAVNQLEVILYSDTTEKIFKSEYTKKPPPVKDLPAENIEQL